MIYKKVYKYLVIIVLFISLIPLLFKEENFVFRNIEIITSIFFILDYGVSIFTNRKNFYDPIDLINLIASILILFNFSIFGISRLLRLIRLVRLISIYKYLPDNIRLFFDVVKNQWNLLKILLLLSFFYIFVTSIIVFNVEPKSTFKNFLEAFYYCAVTLTTVGYGDISTITLIGRLISIISAFFGIAIIALPSGLITAEYLNKLNNLKNVK